MNIAFPALLIIGLILPGMVFRYTYARGSWGWTSPISFRSVSDELAYSAIFAVGLHFLWALGALSLGYSIDFQSLLAFLTGNFGIRGENYARAIKSIAEHPGAIGGYFLTLYGAAAAAGRSSHWLIRKTGLDLKTQVFRFKNEWFYLLTGEALSFRGVATDPRPIDGVFLSAVVDHGKESYLYRGIVEDWSFDAGGQLESLRLSLAHRRKLDDDRRESPPAMVGSYVPPDDRYYEIRGDLLALRYSEIKTLNLDYFTLADDEGESTPLVETAVESPIAAGGEGPAEPVDT